MYSYLYRSLPCACSFPREGRPRDRKWTGLADNRYACSGKLVPPLIVLLDEREREKEPLLIAMSVTTLALMELSSLSRY